VTLGNGRLVRLGSSPELLDPNPQGRRPLEKTFQVADSLVSTDPAGSGQREQVAGSRNLTPSRDDEKPSDNTHFPISNSQGSEIWLEFDRPGG
jgi:hypothetical protein